jgi:sorbitol-specific phosphotransferase system component IIBC
MIFIKNILNNTNGQIYLKKPTIKIQMNISNRFIVKVVAGSFTTPFNNTSRLHLSALCCGIPILSPFHNKDGACVTARA